MVFIIIQFFPINKSIPSFVIGLDLLIGKN